MIELKSDRERKRAIRLQKAVKFLKRLSLFSLLPALLLISRPAMLSSHESRVHPQSKHLTLGYLKSSFVGVDPNDARVAMKVWIKKLGQKMEKDYIPEAVIIEDFDSLAGLLKSGKIDIVSISPLDYLKYKAKLPLEPIFAAIRGGKPTHEYVLLVHQESGIRDLSALAGKSLFVEMGDRGKISRLWLDNLLMKAGQPGREDFFSGIKEVEKASWAGLPVFFRQADACIVTRDAFNLMNELNPQVGRNLKILIQSPDFLSKVVCIRKDYPPEQKKMIAETGPKIHIEPEGKQMLVIFQEERLIPFNPAYLNNIISLVNEHNDLKKLKAGR